MNKIVRFYDKYLRKVVYEILRRPTWYAIYFLYGARGYGPRHIEGPALRWGLTHESSSDSLILSYFTDPMSIVFLKKRTLLTLAGMVTGGIPVRALPNKTHKLDHELFTYRMENKEIVTGFGFDDVGGKRRLKGLVKSSMDVEKELGIHINYSSFLIEYKYRFSKLRYFPKLRWPIPLISSATIYVNEPLSSDRKSLDELVKELEESAYKVRKLHAANDAPNVLKILREP